MKLRDVVGNIDNNYCGYADIDNLANIVGLNGYYEYTPEWEKRVKKYYIKDATWICTDELVGLAVYHMDGELIAVTYKNCRKCDEVISFVSNEAAQKLRAFILSMTEFKNYPVVDLDEDLLSWENI